MFDASAKYDGKSLNDVIYQGPKLQQELFDVLLRFRRLPVTVVCDIAEMYLRIGIAPEDKRFHRFLWRGIDQARQPEVYEFDRVVFGVNSSLFQAQFVLQHHAKKFQDAFPMAAETILKSTYMDSVLDEADGLELHSQLSHLLSKAGMHTRKWLSNCAGVLKEIPIKDRKAEVDLDRDYLPCAKTLGVWWHADEDVFTFKKNAPGDGMKYTKRNFLSKIANLFDPIGFLAQFTIRAKILLQEMWTAGLEWNQDFNEPLTSSARAWFDELKDLKVRIPRCLMEKSRPVDTVTLHTFVDASEAAYGAVVYARYCYKDGAISTNIVAAKTRVAPSKATSIPRLELMGAVTGIRLSTRISKVLELTSSQPVFWSDSLSVLWWVRGRSWEFKPFVANRVGEIQSHSSPEQWRYVPTNLNQADILSRGMKATDLVDCDRWWRGPEFLHQSESLWPTKILNDKHTGYDEMKAHIRLQKGSFTRERTADISSESVFVTVAYDKTDFPRQPSKYSNWPRLKRVLAWVNRFNSNCSKRAEHISTGELLSDELKQAEIQLIKFTQIAEFPEEWKALSNGKALPSGSKLLGLHPKLDDDGLMRSDGRLKYAKFLSYDVRFPVILPRNSWVTKLLVKEYHEKGNHATGTNQTLAALSTRYWILSGREVIREWERECTECRRRKSKPCQQIMAPLPAARLKTMQN